ncbi:nuclear hormone receptor FTZ-F1-like protein [Dinothrombium tinctorium]|uniref:Nuclear hormone receptor FTZ-F1 n=1 Tax=Dinothrombium tinctorium TaxID=1965070 RepID=A0A443RP93_9ACAR|nr:nuclear hormone receptor FTZ-F1-like protein [Dinothrombium tinctorium]
MMSPYMSYHIDNCFMPTAACSTNGGSPGPQPPSSALSLTICGTTSSVASTGPSTPTISSAGLALVPYGQEAPDTKEGLDELCPVCGDKVSGYHYGLLTCESCKGFFKRTVQNKKVYTCVADRNCHIDKSQRKRCPFCRFQKCLDVGMKLEAVRADRMRGGRNKFGPMYKRDRARRLQLMRQRQMAIASIQSHPQLALTQGNNSPGEAGGSSPFVVATINNVGNVGTQATTIYTADGIKQELIQIPQLSSSTSSPDSSPSPGQTTLTTTHPSQHFQTTTTSGGHPSGHQLPGTLTGINVNHQEMVKWVPVSSPSAAPSSRLSLKTPGPGIHLQYTDNGQPSPVFGPSAGPALPLTSGASGSGKIPEIIRELQMTAPDDKEWQSQLFGLLQNQTYNQCEVDLFELMCKVIDQSLFAQVDWARNSIFFKDLKVDDQMKLLQHAWSDMLILDHIHQRMHNGLPDETTLPNGQKFDLLGLALLGVPAVAESLQQVQNKLAELKFDPTDYLCVKFLLLLNPEVRGLSNLKLVQDAHEQTQHALLDYTLNFFPHVPDKFGQLVNLFPQIRLLTMRGEEFLYFKHLSGSAPVQTLLMEMLHAKRK